MNQLRDRHGVTGPLLEVDGLSVDFAVDNFWIPAAKDLKYSVSAGKCLAIVGSPAPARARARCRCWASFPRTRG